MTRFLTTSEICHTQAFVEEGCTLLKGETPNTSPQPSPQGEGTVVDEHNANYTNSGGVKKAAFTLAETLITLSILGIIAAVSIPGIISNYRKAEIQSRFKIAYSMLENVMSMAAAENDGYDNILLEADNIDIFTQKYIIPYLNYSLYCVNGKDYNTNNTNNMCQKIFKPTKANAGWIVDMKNESLGYSETSYYSWRNKFILKNGMYFALYPYSSGADSAYHIRFVFDVNGAKEPNKIGYDIFYFSVFRSMTGRQDLCRTNPVGKYCNKGGKIYGGVENYEWSLSDGSATCSGTGLNCANVIIRNGLKIPDNYPAF